MIIIIIIVIVLSYSVDQKADSFLFQRLSIALQRYNAILLHKSFIDPKISSFQTVFNFPCF